MPTVQIRLPVRARLLACTLLLSACTSGIKIADQACSASQTTASAFANCLRNNYATLTSGPYDDLGSLYLAAAENEAHEVAIGDESDAQAMVNLATFRMEKIAPVEQKRRDEQVQKFIQAMQSSQKQNETAAQHGTQSVARNSMW